MNKDFFLSNCTLEDAQNYLQEIVNNKYNEADRVQIYEAYNLACNAHKKQLRSDNVPFIIHPIRVALMLVHFDRNITSKVFISALLHDVLEDTDLTKIVIEEKFGKYVARLVSSVTRRHKKSALPQEKLEDKRQKWEEIICNDHEVRAIKTFEDLDNILCWKTISAKNPDRINIHSLLKEAQEMSLPLARATNLQAYEIMQQECRYYDTQDYVR